MTDERQSQKVTIPLSDAQWADLVWLAAQRETEIQGLAEQLFTEQLEAEVGLTRGPFLRKYMYR